MARLKIKRNNQYWSLHTHSKFSYHDALPTVQEIVDQAQKLGYRGLALTDHGNMAGSVQLYMACQKAGIKPFPGTEMYFVKDRSDKKAKRYHLGLVAYTTEGYRNMVRINTLSHENFYHKPLIDFGDMAQLHADGKTKGVALTTGCFFGLVIQTLIQDGYEAAKQVVATFAEWFDVYVEMQNHQIDHDDTEMTEDEIAGHLMQIADELGLPMVITQDSHYVHDHERPDHESLKRLVAFGQDPDGAVFPGDGFHMVDDRWMQQHHGEEAFRRGMAGLEDLLSKWDMAIPEMDHYDYKVPDFGDGRLLKQRAVRRATELGLATKKKYFDQIMLEFEIIDFARMWGYLGLVTETCDHLREVSIFYQIRGSAGGSLICYLLGITEHDPIRWKLRMDRFLSKDRTKPPDIDIDVESNRRQEVLDWLAQQYAMVRIGNWRTLSINGDENDAENTEGSLMRRFIQRKKVVDPSFEYAKSSPQDRAELFRLNDLECLDGYGTHAAGVVVVREQKQLDEMVPMMWNANRKWMVSQYIDKDVEAIGLVKLDVLGVRNLEILRLCLLNLGRDPAEGLGWIPLTDRNVFATMSRGDVDGFFQLEGKTNRREIRTLKPTKIADVIAAMALFRPGVMTSGGLRTYYDRRFKRETAPDLHPLLHNATKDTEGILLYQDSVIEILRGLGMSPDDLTSMLKAVKASNKNVAQARVVMEKHKPNIFRMCAEKGMKEWEANWLWNGIEGFAEYSFNRAHATIYGITAYRCGYLATHHPLEWHAAMLAASSGTDKEDAYLQATRRKQIRLMRPDINDSKATYAVDPKGRGIRKGLASIKGIGVSTAEKIAVHAPFKDVADLCTRAKPSGSKDFLNSGSYEVGILNKLYEARALNSILEEPVI
jgi:DNA polymerase-3 subunit alpha